MSNFDALFLEVILGTVLEIKFEINSTHTWNNFSLLRFCLDSPIPCVASFLK